MKILFVLEYYPPHIGGVETLFENLITSLSNEKIDYKIITTFHPDRSSSPNITQVKCRNRYLFSLFALYHCFQQAKEVDLVHTTSYNAAIPAFFAAKYRKKKIIITFHEVWGNLWLRLPFMNPISKIGHFLFEQFILKLPFDIFHAPSQSTAKTLESHGVKAKKITQIYPGINLDQIPKDTWAPPREPMFTYFGRLGISKGLKIMLPAVINYLQQNPTAEFQFIIPRRPKKIFLWIQRKIKKARMTGRIQIYPIQEQEKLFETLSKSTAIIIPSHSEGFCFAATEAQAIGVPILASKNGSLPEVVGGLHNFLSEISHDALIYNLTKAQEGHWKEKAKREFQTKEFVKEYVWMLKKMNE